MSFDDIIVHVQAQPELWLRTHPCYKNRAIHKKTWRTISKDLNIDEIILKKRWKHLKDQYRKELKKAKMANHSDVPENYMSTWQWYPALGFLKDELLHKSKPKPSTTLSETESQSEDAEESTTLKKSKKMAVDDSKTLDSKKISVILKRLNTLNDTVETKLKAFDEVPKNDTDYMFLMSLLPSMKQLSEIQKLHFRGKINDWLLEAMTQNEYSSCDNKFFFQAQVTDLHKED